MANYVSITSPQRETIVSDHKYRLRYFKTPAWCPYCEDYIWGSGNIGYQCTNCGDYFHVECTLVLTTGTCPGLNACHTNNRTLITSDTSISINDWTVSDVCEWLAVVNLYRYAPNFQSLKYDGEILLSLTDEQLKHDHIHDSYQRQAILDAIKELKTRDKYRPISFERFRTQLSTNNHGDNFICTTFYERRICDLCEKYLYGIIHQGLQCSRCGLVMHRQCSKLPSKRCIHTNKQLECHTIIGTDFNDQPIDSKTQLPIIITRLCQSLENIVQDNPILSLIDAYRFSIESARIAQLRKLINDNDIEKMDFKKMELSELASLVKISLKEPGIGIIPDENYEDFLNLVNAPTQVIQEFVRNYSMPFYVDFLKFMMCHIIKIWKLDYDLAMTNINQHHTVKPYEPERVVDKLVAIFKQLIFRPPWPMIMSHARNDKDHVHLLKRFIYEIDWNAERPPLNAFQQTPPINTLISQQQSLDKCPWFYNRQDNQLLTNKLSTKSVTINDGDYYVRFSTEASVSAPFTLVVQLDGQQRFIKICMNKQGQYGFSLNSCFFPTIQDLIEYYTHNSLSKHFPILNSDMKLAKPIRRDIFLSNIQHDDLDNYAIVLSNINDQNLLRIALLELTMKYNEMEHDCASLKIELDQIITYMSEIQRSTMAYGRIQIIYEKQMKLNRDHYLQCQKQTEKTEYDRSFKYLEQRVEHFITNLKGLNATFTEQQLKRDQLIKTLDERKTNMINYENKIATCMKILADKGVEQHEINNFLDLPNDEPWYLATINRETAHRLLKSCVEGTYLIRTSSTGLYALTLVHNNVIYDCRIGRDPTQNYAFRFVASNMDGNSFAYCDRSFRSLGELVRYYTEHSLAENNPDLNTCLTVPIKSHANIKI
ncbi:unnamed protein product [Adineta steineri]|uniref:Phosphatidylinositol 3-kinase regulatory subunit alpha n=3 Tax=Adineta steineri TaxID=433720 RepID=A0A819ARF8_9BILA|nr:unnamed protein product [Adineta steineri]CAF3788322.1 unnamed protein product [Adineta steineri]